MTRYTSAQMPQVQITHAESEYEYKLFKANPCAILVRRRGRDQNWRIYGTFDSEERAHAILHMLLYPRHDRGRVVLP